MCICCGGLRKELGANARNSKANIAKIGSNWPSRLSFLGASAGFSFLFELKETRWAITSRKMGKHVVYVGTYTTPTGPENHILGRGIESLSFDDSDGSLDPLYLVFQFLFTFYI